jgi:hypothetical protein
LVDASYPVTVTGLSGVAEVSAGGTHSLARLSDGTIKSWGGNGLGQLGDESMSSRNTPVTVSSISNAKGVSAGYAHSMALLTNGSVKVWGSNQYLQLATNSGTESALPLSITELGIGNVKQLAAGLYSNHVLSAIPNLVLPVELLKFSGNTEGGKNVLTWQTAIEQDMAYFEIERSEDGKKFEKIGNLKAKSAASTYQFDDEHPLSNVGYYRLRMVETDGKSAYSKTITIERNKGLSIKAYPNPMHDELIIELPSTPQKWAIEITDLLGRVIFKQNTEGSNLLTMNTLKWELGVYILKVSDKQNSVQQKIIKQ